MFKRKPDYQKIFSSKAEIRRYIYDDRTKTGKIFGDNDFVNAWLNDYEAFPLICEVILEEAGKGDLPSIKQMIWLSELLYQNAERLDGDEKLQIQMRALGDRILLCEMAMAQGLDDRSYQAMMSSAKLYALLERNASPSDEAASNALNGIVKYAKLFLASGNDDAELIEDAERLLSLYEPLANLTVGMNGFEGADDNEDSEEYDIEGAIEAVLNTELEADAYDAGQILFNEGMKAAAQFRTYEAIDLYTQSFEMNRNASPLINRAKLYTWQLRFDKAIADLEQASYLDRSQGDQFGLTIAEELSYCKSIASARFDGTRERLIADLRRRGEFAYDEVAERFIDVIFKGNLPFKLFHVYNELDSIRKFEKLDDFPEAKVIASLIPQSSIDEAMENKRAVRAFQKTDHLFKSLICVYDYSDMTRLRCRILYNIIYDQPPEVDGPRLIPLSDL